MTGPHHRCEVAIWFLTQTALPHNEQCFHAQTLRCRHNGRDIVSNNQPHHCLLNRLFRRRWKKTSKLRVTGLCMGNSPGTIEFPAQMASNAENVSIWWRLEPPKCRKSSNWVTDGLSVNMVNTSLNNNDWVWNTIYMDVLDKWSRAGRLFGQVPEVAWIYMTPFLMSDWAQKSYTMC